MTVATPPLEDPAYEPVHRPVNGKPPAIVARWGAASQVRWFNRFWGELRVNINDVAGFYCHSAEHLGSCCASCEGEAYDGYDPGNAGCCCRSDKVWSDIPL